MTRMWHQASCTLCGPLAACASVALFGCAATVGEPGHAPVSIPADWTAIPAKTSPTDGTAVSAAEDWVTLIGDPQLAALLQTASRENVDVRRALIRMARAQTQLSLNRSHLWPIVQSGAYAAAERELKSQVTPATITVNGVQVPIYSNPVSTFVSGNAAIAFTYEIDLWRGLSLAAAQGQLQVGVAQQDLAAARWLQTIKVAEQYWILAAAQQQAELAESTLRDNKLDEKAITLRHEQGFATLTEILRAHSARRQSETARATIGAQIAEYRMAIAVLVGTTPEALQLDRADLPGTDPPAAFPDTPVAVLDRRPDVHSARLAVERALLGRKIAVTNMYPKLVLNASIISGGSPLSQTLRNPIGSSGIGLSLPFLDWQSRLAERRNAESDIADAVENFRQALVTALVDVETAFTERERLLAQRSRAQDRFDAAQRMCEVSALRYRAGDDSAQDVRETNREAREAMIELISARLGLWINYVEILKATGGAMREARTAG